MRIARWLGPCVPREGHQAVRPSQAVTIAISLLAPNPIIQAARAHVPLARMLTRSGVSLMAALSTAWPASWCAILTCLDTLRGFRVVAAMPVTGQSYAPRLQLSRVAGWIADACSGYPFYLGVHACKEPVPKLAPGRLR